MSHPHVSLRLPDGRVVVVGAGGILGRQPSAAAFIPSPRVSEVHAYVSLRDGRFLLFPLRGAVAVAGRRVEEVELQPGMRVQLAAAVEIEVVEVGLPDHVLALVDEEGVSVALVAAIYSLGAQGVRPGFDDAAAAWVFSGGPGWFARTAQGVEQLAEGGSLNVDGAWFGLRRLALGAAGASPTEDRGRVYSPLHLHLCSDSARVTDAEGREVHFSGRPAELLWVVSGALGANGLGSIGWKDAAREVWGRTLGEVAQKDNFYKQAYKVRDDLEAAGLRPGVLANRGGRWSIALDPGDVLTRG